VDGTASGDRNDVARDASSGLTWVKSSASASEGCVEVAHDGARTLVRDSKDPDGARLAFTPREWECFVKGVKQGEFD
jgi:hypothetical protein